MQPSMDGFSSGTAIQPFSNLHPLPNGKVIFPSAGGHCFSEVPAVWYGASFHTRFWPVSLSPVFIVSIK